MLEVVPFKTNRIYKLVRIVPHVIISKNIVFLSLKIDVALTNSADSNEMPHNAAFHLGLHCLSKYRFKCF